MLVTKQAHIWDVCYTVPQSIFDLDSYYWYSSYLFGQVTITSDKIDHVFVNGRGAASISIYYYPCRLILNTSYLYNKFRLIIYSNLFTR